MGAQRTFAASDLRIILQEHQLWMKTAGHQGKCADLHGAYLRHIFLRDADLRRVDLRDADLRGVDLRGADLQGSDLRGADLEGADLEGAALWDADLRGAQFNTNIRHCRSFARARFSSDALSWLILHPRWAEWKDSVRIEEAVV